MSTTGGERLRQHIQDMRMRAKGLENEGVEVGFRGHIAGLAATHEFGNKKVPERPAFRRALRQAEPLLQQWLKDLGRTPTKDDIEAFAAKFRDLIKQGYLDYDEGPPLSERQRRRKAGTPYASDQLVGMSGPKLIEHITAWVGGVEVD